jgi:dipeptidyl aminopeptidase/acylaminoacyl peptidase
MRSLLFFVSCMALVACAGEAVEAPPVNPPKVVPHPPPPAPTLKPAAATTPAPDPLEASVRSMAQIKRAWAPSFSPDGKRIVFISDLTGLPSIYTVPTEGGTPEQVPTPKDQVRFVTWSPDGAWLAFVIAPGGGMNQQVYLMRPDGKDLRRITDGGKDNNWLSKWSYDAKALTLSSNRREPASMDAYVVDVASQKLTLVSKNPGIGSFSDIRRDRSAALLTRMVNRGNNNLFHVEVPSGKEVLLTPHEGPGTFFGAFSSDGKTVYLGSNKDRDRIAFAKIKLGAAGKPGPIEIIAARDDAELRDFQLNEQGTTAVLNWNVAGKSELAFMDLKSEKITQTPKLPAEMAGGLTFSKDGGSLAMVLSGPALPPDIWVLDVKSGAVKQITHSPKDGVALDSLIRPELVDVTAHDGLKFSGWLYRPRGATKPGSLVLSYHGGPEGQEVPGFVSDYQALLSQGIAVFAPNVRGSSGFGKKFVNLDNGALRINAVKDIRACVDYVVRAGIADPKRIGIMGGSYGGYMVMAGLTEYPDLLAAGANFFGIVNFATFFKHTEPWMAAISKIEYGDPDKEAEMLRSLSPIHKLDRIVAPTIVLHGANDTNVPVVEAEQVVETLKKRGVPVEYVLFPDEGHGFQKTENRIRHTVAVVRWFSKHLAPPPGVKGG